MGDIRLDYVVDIALVNELLERLMMKLQPASLGVFLSLTVKPWLEQRVEDRFASEGDASVGQWAALAPLTIEDRLAKGFDAGPIQQRTGELLNFFKSDGEIRGTQLGTNLIYPSPPPTGTVGYKVGSAQSGNTRTGAPPRPVLTVDQIDQEFIMMGLASHLTGMGIL